jgi:PAS domain S-box-containing protein
MDEATDAVAAGRRFAEQLPGLAALLYDSDDGIVALDAAWIVTAWNRGAERIHGWTADEAVGRPGTEVVRMEMSSDERAAIRRETAETGRWRGEVVARRKDGMEICIDLHTVVVAGQHGGPPGYVSVHRDVTQRKRAERELRSTHRQLEIVLEGMSDAFVAIDAEWRCTYINERALERLRVRTGDPLTRDDILGTDIWAWWAPGASGTELARRLRRAMADQRPFRHESYFPPTDEWLETAAYPSANGLTIYYRSIDDRKRAEADSARWALGQAAVAGLGLRALANDDVQALMDDAVTVAARVVDVDIVGLVEIVPGGEQLLLRAGVGWGDGEIGHAVGPAGRGSLVGYAVMVGEPVVSVDLRTDQRFQVSPALAKHGPVSGVSVVIEGGEAPFGALGAFSMVRRQFRGEDVSFLQAVANTLSTALERAAAERRLIEVKDAERRRIARDLHDEALQTLSFAQVNADPALRPALTRVAEQLRAAIYDLRLGSDSDTSFAQLLAELVDLHRAMAPDADIELEIEESLPVGPLGANGSELLRILGEALHNARRHAGARTIRVRAYGSPHALVTEVSDDGRGFDPAARRGTGIEGMRERSSLLNARLDIESTSIVGTRVRVELPLVARAVDGTAPSRILLVEDDESISDSIAWLLGREPDFDVVGQATSLADARGRLRNVDVAVIDLGLPDGFGGDLVEELRRASPRAQSLVLTASIDDEDIARAYASGAAAVLSKVAQLDQLIGTIRRLTRPPAGPRA